MRTHKLHAECTEQSMCYLHVYQWIAVHICTTLSRGSQHSIASMAYKRKSWQSLDLALRQSLSFIVCCTMFAAYQKQRLPNWELFFFFFCDLFFSVEHDAAYIRLKAVSFRVSQKKHGTGMRKLCSYNHGVNQQLCEKHNRTLSIIFTPPRPIHFWHRTKNGDRRTISAVEREICYFGPLKMWSHFQGV